MRLAGTTQLLQLGGSVQSVVTSASKPLYYMLYLDMLLGTLAPGVNIFFSERQGGGDCKISISASDPRPMPSTSTTAVAVSGAQTNVTFSPEEVTAMCAEGGRVDSAAGAGSARRCIVYVGVHTTGIPAIFTLTAERGGEPTAPRLPISGSGGGGSGFGAGALLGAGLVVIVLALVGYVLLRRGHRLYLFRGLVRKARPTTTAYTVEHELPSVYAQPIQDVHVIPSIHVQEGKADVGRAPPVPDPFAAASDPFAVNFGEDTPGLAPIVLTQPPTASAGSSYAHTIPFSASPPPSQTLGTSAVADAKRKTGGHASRKQLLAKRV